MRNQQNADFVTILLQKSYTPVTEQNMTEIIYDSDSSMR